MVSAVFISIKTIKSSFANELGVLCHCVQQGKDRKGQVLAEKRETSQGKEEKNPIRLILHLFLLRGYALVLTGYLRFNIRM